VVALQVSLEVLHVFAEVVAFCDEGGEAVLEGGLVGLDLVQLGRGEVELGGSGGVEF